MFWIMTVKDLKLMLRDRKALLITVLMPAILTTILGFSIGAFFDNEIQLDPAKVAVVSYANLEEDAKKLQSFFSQQVVQMGLNEEPDMLENVLELNFEKIFLNDVLLSETIQQFIEYEQMPFEEAKKRLNEGSVTAVIIIPEHFHYDLWISFFTPFRNEVQISILKTTGNELKAGIVEMIVKGFTDHVSVGVIGKQVLLEKAAEFNVAEAAYEELGQFMESMMTIQLDQTMIEGAAIEGKDKITSFHYYAVAMGAMFMLYSAGFAASYCVNERFLLTFARIRTAGVSIVDILAGRMLSCTIFTFLQLGVLIGFSTLLFQISWGSMFVILPLTIIASLSVGCLAVLLSVINLQAANDRISNLFQSAIIPLMALIGGSFVPSGGFPEFFRVLGDKTMNGATLNGFLKSMQGFSLGEVQGDIFILLIYSFVFLVVAAFLVKLKEV